MAAEEVDVPMVAPPVRENPRHTRFLARQPILDKPQNVIGYELLFRSGWENLFRGDDNDSTRQMLDNIVVLGAEVLSSDTLAFVNCTREALVGRLVTLLPPRHTVLEILETVQPDPEVIAACRELKSKGYRLALDDFYGRHDMGELIELADFVKVDFQALSWEERKKVRALVQGSSAALIAEKVETEGEFANALAEGYDYFQGYFFCRPAMLSRGEVPPNCLNYLRLVAALNHSPLDHREITQIVMADAPLCFRLLRLANSAKHGIRKPIVGVERALVVVGEHEFRKLATVSMAGSLGDQRPHALLSLSLQRARFCELLAPYLQQDPSEQYLMGLLSLLDAILQMSMTAIVDSLSLEPAVREALLGAPNAKGVPLAIARSYETGEWNPAVDAKEIQELGSERLNKMYFEAGRWAEKALQSGTEKA
jgi:c-di-GMP-related signal transduction protein